MTDSTTPGWRRQLRWFNDLTAEEAVGALLLVCHSRGWAEQVAARRPYTDLDALQAEADEVWMSLSPQDWLEALDAHPRIGERGGASSAWSRQEQEKVGEAVGRCPAWRPSSTSNPLRDRGRGVS